MTDSYSGKTLYVLLGVDDFELQRRVALTLCDESHRLTYWHNKDQPDFASDSLLMSRMSRLAKFLDSNATEQIWADSWIEQLDAWYQEYGVYDSPGLLMLLMRLQMAARAGLVIKFVLTPTARATRELCEDVPKFFADSALMRQKQADANALAAIDSSISGLLELLPNSTLQTATLED